MRRGFGAFGVALWSLAFGVLAQDLNETNSAILSLRNAYPKIDWSAKTVTAADVTCDGKSETLILGYENNETVWLGVVPQLGGNSISKPVMMRFLVGKHSQDSFCSVPVNIETHAIDCEGDEGESLPGCKQVKGCSDFSLIDDSCDSFHLYWNSVLKKLVWWRR